MGPRLGGNYRVARKAVLADGSEYFFDRQNVQFARAPASEYVAELQALFKSLKRSISTKDFRRRDPVGDADSS